MSKHSERNRKRRMIRAADLSKPILCDPSSLEWIQASEGDSPPTDDAPKRFRMRAYTGGPMVVGYYGSPVVIDMAGMKAEAGFPILLNHDPEKIVGHSDDVKIGTTTLDLAGVVSGATSESAQVVASAKLGFPWKASVGASPDKMEFVGEGVKTQVNGKTYTGPLYVARKSTLGEVSFVAMAADRKTSATVAAIAASFPRKERSMDLNQWAASKGIDIEAASDEARKYIQELYDADVKAKAAEKKPAVNGTEPEKPLDISGITLAYERHVAGVQAKAAEYTGKIEAAKLGEIQATAGKKAAELKLSALNDGWTPDRLQCELVKAEAAAEVEMIRAERPKAPAIHGSTRDVETAPVIEAAMCQALGVKDYEEQYDEKTLQAAHTAFRGRVGLQQILIRAASANGLPIALGERVHNGNIRDVIAYALPNDIRAAQASTINLPSIFSNVANKELLAGFMEEDQTWREVAVTKTVTDFKSVTSYRMLDNMEYEELPPDGQIKHGHVGEETYTRQAKTYAKMFALTRTDIVNDDMGAFDDLRTRLGRGAAKKFNKVFWTEFLDNSTFFTSARANYISGATTNLLTDYVGLQAGLTAFDGMKSTAVPPAKVGERIGGTPTVLLVPPELEAVALQIYAPIAAAETSKVNIYSGKFRPVKVHQLSDSTYAGFSATAWYLLRNPSVLAAMVVSLLDGNATPIVESADASFDRLGIEFRGYHDFGCDKAEFLCGVKSKGAA